MSRRTLPCETSRLMCRTWRKHATTASAPARGAERHRSSGHRRDGELNNPEYFLVSDAVRCQRCLPNLIIVRDAMARNMSDSDENFSLPDCTVFRLSRIEEFSSIGYDLLNTFENRESSTYWKPLSLDLCTVWNQSVCVLSLNRQWYSIAESMIPTAQIEHRRKKLTVFSS